jgi:hypothetical protein
MSASSVVVAATDIARHMPERSSAAQGSEGCRNLGGHRSVAPQTTARDTSLGTTGNSPQTNHRKNITSLFLGSGEFSSVHGSSAAAPRWGAPRDVPWTLVRGTPKRAADFTPGEIAATPARQELCTRGGGGVMPDQDELDAMTKAWTYAVLDALEAADEKTRLEIVRILCPAGFVIVPAEMMEAPTGQKN